MLLVVDVGLLTDTVYQYADQYYDRVRAREQRRLDAIERYQQGYVLRVMPG